MLVQGAATARQEKESEGKSFLSCDSLLSVSQTRWWYGILKRKKISLWDTEFYKRVLLWVLKYFFFKLQVFFFLNQIL